MQREEETADGRVGNADFAPTFISTRLSDSKIKIAVDRAVTECLLRFLLFSSEGILEHCTRQPGSDGRKHQIFSIGLVQALPGTRLAAL